MPRASRLALGWGNVARVLHSRAITGEGSVSLDQMRHYQSKLAYEMDSADLYEAIQNGEAIVVVDGRSARAFADEHIPDAISLPHREISANSTASFDTSKLYVCYCDGIGCNASTKTALKLLTLGFDVRELIGGLDWWKRDGYATHQSDAETGNASACGCQ